LKQVFKCSMDSNASRVCVWFVYRSTNTRSNRVKTLRILWGGEGRGGERGEWGGGEGGGGEERGAGRGEGGREGRGAGRGAGQGDKAGWEGGTVWSQVGGRVSMDTQYIH
jgi:hypothetical protein